jgi:nucleotide-binding universal stress UspA family protein
MLRSVLVHVDASERCHARLLAARNLARRHEARLVALYADAPAEIDAPFGYAAGSTAARQLQERELDRRAGARARFESLVGRQPDTGWFELNGEAPALGVARQALCHDLIVLGQHEPRGSDAPGLPDDFVESVIIASGRPALVLPRSGGVATPPATVVVAWKPSSASAHALAGALPLLRAATQVHVVSWAETPSPESRNGDDVLGYLQRHGVHAHWQQHAKAPRDICQALLAQCALLEADLLVMGCYSHARMRERLLGGVTREMLRSMTLPVLMAH